MTRTSSFLTSAFCLLPFAFDQSPPWPDVLSQPAAWYKTEEAVRIADNVLAYQRAIGGWPKDIDKARALTTSERARVVNDKTERDATIDNGATLTELRYLALVYSATRAERFRDAFVSGFEYVLSAQYENGGWPQYFPLRPDYSRHITLNDGAMVGVLALLRDMGRGRPPFDFVAAEARERAAKAGARGFQILLRVQIKSNGRLTGWAQQYDARTLEPAPARSYEHAALASLETVGVVRLLMGMAIRDSATTPAIEGAVDWLKRVQIRGQRLDRRPDPSAPGGYDLVLVDDAAAGPLWARFYEIGTDRPFFAGRDGVKRARLADIDVERRTGYSWLGPYAARLLSVEYPAWLSGR
jgi:PelA/Pel-15E family pectate lyase